MPIRASIDRLRCPTIVAFVLLGAACITPPAEASRDDIDGRSKSQVPFENVKEEIQEKLSQAAQKLVQSSLAQAEVTKKVVSHIGQYHKRVKNIASTMGQVLKARSALTKAYHEDIKLGEESRVQPLLMNSDEIVGEDGHLPNEDFSAMREGEDQLEDRVQEAQPSPFQPQPAHLESDSESGPDMFRGGDEVQPAHLESDLESGPDIGERREDEVVDMSGPSASSDAGSPVGVDSDEDLNVGRAVEPVREDASPVGNAFSDDDVDVVRPGEPGSGQAVEQTSEEVEPRGMRPRNPAEVDASQSQDLTNLREEGLDRPHDPSALVDSNDDAPEPPIEQESRYEQSGQHAESVQEQALREGKLDLEESDSAPAPSAYEQEAGVESGNQIRDSPGSRFDPEDENDQPSKLAHEVEEDGNGDGARVTPAQLQNRDGEDEGYDSWEENEGVHASSPREGGMEREGFQAKGSPALSSASLTELDTGKHQQHARHRSDAHVRSFAANQASLAKQYLQKLREQPRPDEINRFAANQASLAKQYLQKLREQPQPGVDSQPATMRSHHSHGAHAQKSVVERKAKARASHQHQLIQRRLFNNHHARRVSHKSTRPEHHDYRFEGTAAHYGHRQTSVAVNPRSFTVDHHSAHHHADHKRSHGF